MFPFDYDFIKFTVTIIVIEHTYCCNFFTSAFWFLDEVEIHRVFRNFV